VVDEPFASTPVEFLWWRGCPSWERALERLRAAMEGVGLDPGSIVVREVETGEDAEAEQFVGSPTIRVGGRDIQPPAEAAAGLTCRVYELRDGRISAIPDSADIREALIQGIERSGR
jgi:hypothetical protein